MMPLRTVNVTRYMQPFREGGSLPALAESNDGSKYVVKFRGSGNGVKTLIAELIGGELARALGLKVPELVFAELDECFGITEGDEEIQDLLKASKGLNLALQFISGAFSYDPVVTKIDPYTASENTNMLTRNKELWLIDHGSSMYFHYNWETWEQKATAPFNYLKDHVLLPQADKLEEADTLCRELINEQVVSEIVSMIPDDWLVWDSHTETPEELRDVYKEFLTRRLNYSPQFIKEALDAKAHL